MRQIPTPGPGSTNWAVDLNDFLLGEHKEDGSHLDGEKPLTNFLYTEHNEDGTHSAGASIAVDWKTSGHTAVKEANNQFSISGADHTDIYTNGLRVAMISGETTCYATALSSSYGDGKTTVTIDDTNVPAAIDTLKYGIVKPGPTGGLPAMGYLGQWSKDIECLLFDEDDPPKNVFVNTDTPAVAFDGAADTKGRFSFRVPEAAKIDVSKDLVFHAVYSMSTSETDKKISMNLDWRQNGGSATSVEDEISVPDDTTWATHDGSNLKIATGAYAAGDVITGLLWRDIDGVAANHGGDFQLIKFWVTNG